MKTFNSTLDNGTANHAGNLSSKGSMIFLKTVIVKYILLSIAVFLNSSIYAQLPPVPQTLENSQCIDTSMVEVRYSFKFKSHSSQKQYNEDIRVVQVGRNTIKDYSEIVYHYDSLATENYKKGLSTSNNPHVTYPCEIYSYLANKQRLIKYRMILNAGVLCYPSEWEELQWEYSSEEPVKIHDLYCNKAITRFAGREYIAYYTIDIPMSYGPYKFYGLPGLIVRLEESSGMYIWEMCSLNRGATPIYLYEYEKEQKCTEESAARTIYRMMTSPMTFLSSTGSGIMVRQRDGSFGAPSKGEEKILYEPIELK